MKKLLASLLLIVGLSLTPAHAETGMKLNTELNLSITTTSTQALPYDKFRRYLLILNRGTDSIYVKVNSVHTGTEGIIIPYGGNWEPVIAPINSIYIKAASGTQDVIVLHGD